MLYNKQWRAIAQNRDPVILGMTFAAGWPELNQYFRPILDKGYYKGEKTTKGMLRDPPSTPPGIMGSYQFSYRSRMSFHQGQASPGRL